MKPYKNPKIVPAGIYKRAAQVPQDFALLIFLDSIPYCEIAEKSARNFDSALGIWKRTILPTLEKSDVRYFYRDGDRKITEVRF